MLSKIVLSLLAGLSCGLLLNVFYLALKHVWPDNYFGLSGSVDPVVSRNLPRWAVFRLVPPAIAGAAAALTAERAEGFVWVALVAALVIHVWRLVRAAVAAVRRRYRAAGLQSAVVAIVVSGIMVGACFARSVFAPIVPNPSDLVSNIWAGFLAAIGAIYLQRIVLLRKKPRELLRHSFDEIPVALLGHAWSRALEVGIDPRIPLAVMAVENLQRPLWVRRFEHRLPRWLGGTRGIMQQEGATNDLQSIDLAFERYFGPAAANAPEPGDLSVFEQYNPSPEFNSLAHGAFETLDNEPELLSRAAAAYLAL